MSPYFPNEPLIKGLIPVPAAALRWHADCVTESYGNDRIADHARKKENVLKEKVRHLRLVPPPKAAQTTGGLAGVEAFLSRMPADFRADIALVLVQRLSPDCTNRLAEMITRYIRMSPIEVEDGMQLRHACAYVVPPGRELTLRDGRAHLRRRATLRGRKIPDVPFFDLFNLASGRRAIGILFSGSGCEGGRNRSRSAPAPEIARISCVVREGY